MNNNNLNGSESDISRDGVFRVGSAVSKTTEYICVPCGYKRKLSKGDVFPKCDKCLEGKKFEGDDYISGLGLWEEVDS